MFGDAGGPESQAESETGRVEAFSDGVLAVIITIMALELRAPLGGSFADLRARLPALLVYILSFVFIGIYWNNHHHLLRAARRVTGGVMWANLHLLFWLSLIPVLTEWIGEHYSDTAPAATYGVVASARRRRSRSSPWPSSAPTAVRHRWQRPSAATSRAAPRWSCTRPRSGWRSSARGSPTPCSRPCP